MAEPPDVAREVEGSIPSGHPTSEECDWWSHALFVDAVRPRPSFAAMVLQSARLEKERKSGG